MSLIHSYINYCNVVWGSAYSTHLKPLVTLQKKAIRIINKSKFDTKTSPIFHSLGILNVENVHKLNCLTFMFNCLEGNKFPIFRNKVMENAFNHNYNTRNREQLNPPFERLEICRKSFFCKGIDLWNNLNLSLECYNNVHSFKKIIKSKLIDGDF